MGKGLQHGGKKHNGEIDERIGKVEDNGAKNIRKNQQQVDINGNKVGNNRPDLQYDKDGVHYNEEFDSRTSSMEKHKNTIEHNDPDAINLFHILK